MVIRGEIIVVATIPIGAKLPKTLKDTGAVIN